MINEMQGMQNSGLGNAVNPIASLIDEKVYKIPNVKSYMNYEPKRKKKVYVYFDKVISINYVYDSFYRGNLIEINFKVTYFAYYFPLQIINYLFYIIQ